MNLVNRAWLFARNKHEGQLDDDGNPYFDHPVQVASILRLVTGDEDLIAAGLLHDTLEDTDTTSDQLRWEFNQRVADLVLEVTNEGKKDNLGFYFPRLKSRDAILVKFADRLSNLSRMNSWSKERQEYYLRKSKFWKSSNLKMKTNKNFKVIFEGLAGSHLYGTATKDSDVDTRGVFIPTEEYFFGFLHTIEQIEDKKTDTTHFDIRKFLKLASDCNPNIVELLFVPEERSTVWTEEWSKIIEIRDLILSKKARWTFSGYAVSQLHRIEQHRNWLLSPPRRQPLRSDFGLPIDRTLVSKDQLNAYEELKTTIDSNFELDPNTLEALKKEKAFLNSNREWSNYQNWRTTRNTERAALEEKFGFDTKHGSHLYRLVTEGKELLLTGSLTFPRPDADLLLEIRQGRYSYEELVDLVGDIDSQFNTYYEESSLPYKADVKKIDSLCIELVRDYLVVNS